MNKKICKNEIANPLKEREREREREEQKHSNFKNINFKTPKNCP